jgi:hypothetical protein
MILPILFAEFVLIKRNFDFQSFFTAISDVSWAVWILLALMSVFIFFLLMQTAVRVKARQREG